MKRIKGVYLVEFENGIKVGYSDDLAKRLACYKQVGCREILSITFKQCKYPRYVESLILAKFKANRASNGSREFITGIKVETILNHFVVSCDEAPNGMFKPNSKERATPLVSTCPKILTLPYPKIKNREAISLLDDKWYAMPFAGGIVGRVKTKNLRFKND